MSDLHACGHIRGEIVAREINRQYGGRVTVDCKSVALASDLYQADIMVLQRQHNPHMLGIVEAARRAHVATVYDVDDHLLEIPEGFGKAHEFYARPDVREAVTALMRAVDAVTVSTPELGRAMEAVCPGVRKLVVRNALDVEQWERAQARRDAEERGRAVTVGYMASGSHVIDWPLVHGPVLDLLERHDEVGLHLIGWAGWEWLGADYERFADRIRVEPWLPIERLPDAMADFDVGLAPLADCAFNRCKSELKVLQYWGLGVPAVASNLPMYAATVDDGVTGYLAETGQDWAAALELLVEDAGRRRRMGALGRLRVLEDWDLRRTVQEWVGAFEMVQAQRGRQT